MAAEAAVEVLHRKKLASAVGDERDELKQELMAEHARLAGGPDRAIAIGVLDEVISPRHTRRRLAEALTAAPADRQPTGAITATFRYDVWIGRT